MRVLLDEEAPLKRAKATKAFLGFDRLRRSDAVLLDVLDDDDEEDEGPLRNAGDDKIRGCSS